MENLELEDVVEMRRQLEDVDPGGGRHIIDSIEFWVRQAKEHAAILRSRRDGPDSLSKSVAQKKRAPDFQQQSPWLSADGTLLESAKLTLLKQRLMRVFSEGPGDRVVIFVSPIALQSFCYVNAIQTHFLGMMSIVARLCQDHNWTHTTYNGEMTAKRRNAVVRNFQADGGPQILIASVKAAGEGLTLTQANHVFCCEMWW